MMIINAAPMVQSMMEDIEIGLRWQQIPREGPGKVPVDEQVKAIHIETGKDHYFIVKEILSAVYCVDQKVFPMGVKLRFVPDFYSLTNEVSKAKAIQSWNRQALFLWYVKEMGNIEIASLDHPFWDKNGTKASLRSRIMWLRSKERPYLPQFTSVNKQ